MDEEDLFLETLKGKKTARRRVVRRIIGFISTLNSIR